LNILYLPKNPDATAYFRIDLPLRAMAAAGHEVRSRFLEQIKNVPNSGVREEDVSWADVIVVQRAVSERALGVVRQIKATYPQKAVIGDYDDDYAAVPTWNPGHRFVAANSDRWRAILREMDGVTVSTDPLAAAIENEFEGPVEVVPNGLDFSEFDELPMPPPFPLSAVRLGKDGKLENVYPISSEQFNELMRDRVVVAWAGSRFHFADLDLLASDIPTIMRRHPEVVLLFAGYLQANVLRGAELSRIFAFPGRFPTTAYHAALRSLKMDIMLAPLAVVDPNDPSDDRTLRFNSAKSGLKILEAMALGAYPVCSKLDPYQDDLDEDERDFDPFAHVPRHGRLVPYRRGAWAEAIGAAVELVSDPVRQAIFRRENAEYVRARHTIATRAPLYEDFYTKVLEAKRHA